MRIYGFNTTMGSQGATKLFPTTFFLNPFQGWMARGYADFVDVLRIWDGHSDKLIMMILLLA